MLVVDITMDYNTGIEQCPTSKEQLYPALAGGYTSLFASLPGLRGKYFAYDAATDHCYGFYTFINKESLDGHMASELFTKQAEPPHISDLKYTVQDVLPGTERSIDLGSWKGEQATVVKPGRQDMVDAKLLYVKLKMDYTKNPDMKNVDSLKWVLGDGNATA